MAGLRAEEAIWLTRAPREEVLGRARARCGALLRGLGLAGLAGLVGTLALTSLPPSDLAAAAPVAHQAPAAKSAVRLPAWNGPLSPVNQPLPGPFALAHGLFEARADGSAPARFEPGSEPRPAALAFAPRLAPRPASAVAPGGQPESWQESEHAWVQAVDGRTLDAGDLRIVLAGIGLPDAGQMCRTLDGRIEPCAERAKTQLELLTRSRTLACRTRAVAPGLAEGSCRIGAGDLAERLFRTGFVHRGHDGGRTIAFADTPRR